MSIPLTSEDEITRSLLQIGIENWNQLLLFTRQLPYGRNKNRFDFSLVLKEKKGTCSSKHAFLKQVADSNNIKQVCLFLGIYKMTQQNTPGIGNILEMNGLEYIPEAHCYLSVEGQRIDVTSVDSDIKNIEDDILEEFEIAPTQVITYKVEFHQFFLKKWIISENLSLGFNELWKIREAAISNLSS